MKLIRNNLGALPIIGVLIASLNFVHAQTSVRVTQSSTAGLDVMSILTQARALAAEEPVLDRSIPVTATEPSAEHPPGTYWSLQNILPPLPFDLFPELPLYVIDPTNRVFLVDDRSVDWSAFQAQQGEQARVNAMATSMTAMAAQLPGVDSDGGDSGTNSFTPDGSGYSVDYGTNLWIAKFALSAGHAVGVVSNTTANIPYEIQYKHDLMADVQWLSAGFVLGSEVTNWTALLMANVSLTNNAFFRIRSWADDGSGLPIWWQLQYFGLTGVDPDSDPDGDGKSNWDEFEAGTDPVAFNPPSEITGLQAIITGSNTVIVTWNYAPGAVISYTVYRWDDLHKQQQVFTITGTNQFVDTNFINYPAWNWPISYYVSANYETGNSGQTATSPLLLYGFPSARIVMGTGGATEIAATGIPVGASALAITRLDWKSYYGSPSSTSGSNTFYVPVSAFSAGAYIVPTNLVGLGIDGSDYYVQTVWSNGVTSVASEATHAGYVEARDLMMEYGFSSCLPFYIGRFNDASVQMEQNAIFLLRAASLTDPFVYAFDFGYGMTAVNQPTNYAYASYWAVNGPNYNGLGNSSDLSWSLPFQENYQFRNFVFSTTNINFWGFLNTGVDEDYNLNSPATFEFSATNTTGLPALLAPNQTTWMTPCGDSSHLGITTDSGQFFLPNNIYNYFGLKLLSVLLVHNHSSTLYCDTLNAGGYLPQTNDPYYFYPQFDQPQLKTVGYYFGRTANNRANNGNDDLGSDPLPGNNDFSPTNTQPLLIGAVGTSMQIAAFARQTILNGDTTKPVYVAQYFYKAYKVNATGNVTTNETGVLSPYGDFLPTESGPTALVTMPASDGQRGTGIVQVVSLQLDANHDGNMDLSFYGPDYTPGKYWPYIGDNGSGDRTMKFWVNELYTKPGNGTTLDQDFLVNQNLGNYSNTNIQPNYAYQQIRRQRNLENFARLWVCGLPDLPANQGYTVTLSLVGVADGGKVAVNIYPACETNGGTRYLTDTNVAATQVSSPYGNCLAQIAVALPAYTLPMNAAGQPTISHFLFEGAGVPGWGDGTGLACIALTVSQNGQPLAQTEAYVNFYHVKDLYERAQVTNVVQTWPEMVQQSATSGFQLLSTPGFDPYETSQLAVFIHGWRMTAWDWENFSDLMFKRLYWQGFQGRFASLRWPTRSADTDTNLLFGLIPSEFLTFDRSEHIAFKSGQGAAAYFNDLRGRYTNYIISTCAHSMGNIVMMEALNELAASNQAPLDNYVMMQAAVAAHCYDTTVPSFQPFLDAEVNLTQTPNTYAGYATGIDNALRGKTVNLYNTNDYALATATNELTGMNVSWEGNEELSKPLSIFGYYYIASNHVAGVITNPFTSSIGITNLQTRTLTDPREIMPFVARPRSLAVGAQSGVGGMVNGGEFDLFSIGFGGQPYDHSGEFNRNIQNPQVQVFYTNLVLKLFPPQ
jgi:hypothetical protein